jgi:hypothetical protein
VNLTKAELAAIEYIGRHRKTDVKVGTGKPISSRIFNQLQRKRLVMWMDEKRSVAMLTANGERVWTKLHPTSKYRIS